VGSFLIPRCYPWLYNQFNITLHWRSGTGGAIGCRKVAGSIPNAVIGIFHWHNTSGRTMALRPIQPLKEMSTRNISWGERGPVRGADNLNHPHLPTVSKYGSLPSWNPQGLSRSVQGLPYLYLTVLKKVQRNGSRSKQPNMLRATCYRITCYWGGGRQV
jgi:hypothetical protein